MDQLEAQPRSPCWCWYVWLFHLLGGEAAKLVAPPEKRTTATQSIYVFFQRRRDTFAATEKARRREVERAKPHLVEARTESIRLHLESARGSVLVDSLRDRLQSAEHNAQPAKRRAIQGGGGAPPDPASETQWAQTTHRLLAFAMGTHARVGEGYASRDGPCAVRLVAGNWDMLRQIADRVRNRPPRKLAPPDRELLRLRRLNWQLQTELHGQRAASEEASLTLWSENREWARERAKLEAEICRQALERKRERSEAEARQAETVTACEKEVKRLKACLRSKDKEWKEDATEWQVCAFPASRFDGPHSSGAIAHRLSCLSPACSHTFPHTRSLFCTPVLVLAALCQSPKKRHG